MSDTIAVFGYLVSRLGWGTSPVSDADWRRIADSDELTSELQRSIKRIVGDKRAREREAQANRTSLLNSSIVSIAKVGSQTVITKAVTDKLKGKGLPGSVSVVRDLIKLTREDLRSRNFTSGEILQIETALRAYDLHLTDASDSST